ncbi:hypothetical protein SAY86_009390 [Trapa natans]|uniref:Uncharacterized protein n=1 Tax=Trapa natans TaxID=22666 RepID=A0AAN7QSZ9_TRANT|nr:hypothetical protein SAY86_009390 [Trapa natans]
MHHEISKYAPSRYPVPSTSSMSKHSTVTVSLLVTMTESATRVEAAARALSADWATKKLLCGHDDGLKKAEEFEPEIFSFSSTLIAGSVDIPYAERAPSGNGALTVYSGSSKQETNAERATGSGVEWRVEVKSTCQTTIEEMKIRKQQTNKYKKIGRSS